VDNRLPRQRDIPWTVHFLFAAQPDRFDLIRKRDDWTVSTATEFMHRRKRKNT
jgi:hypothetical protein